jgi:hypothetical protein
VTAVEHDASTLGLELRGILEAGISRQPRSLQRQIGPSELGCACEACLVLRLANAERVPEVALLAFYGSAIHAKIAPIFADYPGGRFLVEHSVTVGEIAGEPISGTLDLYDTATGTLADWKIVGESTLRTARAHGPSAQYIAQVNLYGRGLEREGRTVNTVGVYYLPRHEPNLANALWCPLPYDRTCAEQVLDRAHVLAGALRHYDVKSVLQLVGPHLGEFSCARFGEAHPTQKGAANTAELLNL